MLKLISVVRINIRDIDAARIAGYYFSLCQSLVVIQVYTCNYIFLRTHAFSRNAHAPSPVESRGYVLSREKRLHL